jgi:glutaredoxin 3
MNEQKNVVIYSTPTCTYCKAVKEFFSEKGIVYTEHNVAEDAEKRQEMIEKSGQMGVPVIMIDDKMVIGFDHDQLEELLGSGNNDNPQ